MTDVTYHEHFGSVPNTGYRALGMRLCKLAVTALINTKFPCSTGLEKVILRAECLNKGLIARVGLMLNLHRHLRVLRAQEDETHYITAPQSRHAFEALVGALYIQIGWVEVLAWLETLFEPWLEAANAGALRSSGWRRHQEMLKQNKEAAIRAKNAIQIKTVPEARRKVLIQAKQGVKRKAVPDARARYRPTIPLAASLMMSTTSVREVHRRQ
ncbi:hypothetical protein B0H16DRAFT_464582 [Mycena metata]|uniref:RNase III domain-containing protein n=1 Tax=Mycena metata TaxID=1033252 RepID=A0AAD7KCA5_9AGAR|nr:hypothetical protein B0H16DRAFT_464582 [Mycena metata]